MGGGRERTDSSMCVRLLQMHRDRCRSHSELAAPPQNAETILLVAKRDNHERYFGCETTRHSSADLYWLAAFDFSGQLGLYTR